MLYQSRLLLVALVSFLVNCRPGCDSEEKRRNDTARR